VVNEAVGRLDDASVNEFIALNGPNVSLNSVSESAELSGWIAPSVPFERQRGVSVPLDNCVC
jgi:hypothetical protein